MRVLMTLFIVISAGTACAETVFDASTPQAARDSLHAMAKEVDGKVRGDTFFTLDDAIQKIWASIAWKYLPAEGEPYDPVQANAALHLEFRSLVDGKTLDEIFATAAGIP